MIKKITRASMQGNQHAYKFGYDTSLHIRCLKSQKAAWREAAEAEGVNLTQWIMRRLNTENPAQQ